MLAALVIVFREVIEAGLIVGIVMAATKGVAGRGRMIAAGVSGGIALSILLAAFAGRIGALFAGNGQELFQAAVLLIAVAMLSWHTIWMSTHGREIAREMKELGYAVTGGSRPLTALGIVVGVAVLREGVEVIMFLYGVALSGGVTSGQMLLGGVLGVAAGAGISMLIYCGLLAIPASKLFSVTSGLIALVAAGLAAQAMAFLQQAGIGDTDRLAEPLWNTKWLLAEDTIPGRLAHTLVGYTQQPNLLQLIAYLAVLAGIFLASRTAHGRFSRNKALS